MKEGAPAAVARAVVWADNAIRTNSCRQGSPVESADTADRKSALLGCSTTPARQWYLFRARHSPALERLAPNTVIAAQVNI